MAGWFSLPSHTPRTSGATSAVFSGTAATPGGRLVLAGYLFGETVHLQASFAVEAKGQALDNRPGPAAPPDGPVAPHANAAPHHASPNCLARPLYPYGISPPLHGDSAPRPR